MVASSRRSWSCALLAACALVAPACGEDGAADDPQGGSGAGAGVEGEVLVSGSSTVEPVSARVAELLEEVNPGIAVDVDGPGTGDGFQLFCAGESDIADASRPIKAEEVEACAGNGVGFIELRVAYDGIAVMTNAGNDEVDCLTYGDLYALMGPESTGVSTWSDAQELAAALGSATTFPDAPLDISAPGQESGTYDTFVELVLEDIVEARAAEGAIDGETLIRDFPGQPDDNVILQGIEGSASSFGWVGFAFAASAGDAVKLLGVDAGEGCVSPSPDTIADGSYPLSRLLYLYVSVPALEDNAAVAEYVDFYLSDAGLAAVGEVGYVDLDDASREEARAVWADRTAGTRDGG